MNKKLFLAPIKWYQYISKLTPASCRYYPTCSEYARWLFIFDNPLSATLKSTKRIATCNQLFIGGIDYPKFKYSPPKATELLNIIKRNNLPFKPLKFKDKKSKLRIQFWLIPNGKNYYIIKDFDETATYLPAGYAPAPKTR